MKGVDLYLKVRRAVRIEGLSERAAARRFGIDPRTVSKMMKFSVPPGYRRSKVPAKPKLDPFIAVIDRILEDDKSRPKKQQHTSKRIFERLRDEHGFAGGITIVKDYVAGWRQRAREMFVPLAHPPGHAQADFGEALGVIGGVERKIHFFAMDLPHSDACFVVAYPAETTEAFCDGHVRAFAFFGGVPKSVLYDNTRIAVARILGDGKRQRTRVQAQTKQALKQLTQIHHCPACPQAPARCACYRATPQAGVCGQPSATPNWCIFAPAKWWKFAPALLQPKLLNAGQFVDGDCSSQQPNTDQAIALLEVQRCSGIFSVVINVFASKADALAVLGYQRDLAVGIALEKRRTSSGCAISNGRPISCSVMMNMSSSALRPYSARK